MAPRILIATTCRWFSAARIAMAFSRAGCTVEAICPSGHALHLTQASKKNFTYRPLAPLRSVRAAILSSRPDLIVPCDDLAMKHLHRLYELAARSAGDDSKNLREVVDLREAQDLREVLERSLGDPASYPITESRDRFMAMVDEEGVRAPETKTLASAAEVEDWISQFGLPAVMKADGTSGGEGVKIVRSLRQALRAYSTLHSPVPAIVVAKRAFLDRDWTSVWPWLARRKRAVSIQSFVAGPDANMAIACWQGKILASITVEVLQTWKPKGPATIVRLIQNAEMSRAAEKIVQRLKFSGLCGLDFLIDKATGNAYLIEMNARATQTCTLQFGAGRDLIASLCSALTGQTVPDSSIEMRGGTVALFPLAWQGDTSSEPFLSAYQDVPWDEPDLAREGFEQRPQSSHDRWKRFFSKIGLHSMEGDDWGDGSRANRNVLHLIGSNLVGGPEKQILHHAQDMQNSGYRIAVGSFHDKSERPEVLVAAEARNIPTLCLPGGVRIDLVSQLSRELRRRQGWLLCTHGFKANVVGYLAARRTGTPHVAFVRGFTAENRRVVFYEMLERQALKRAQRVVCVSKKQAEEISRLRGERRGPIVVKNAMLPPWSRPHDSEPVSRDGLGIPRDAFVFGSVGRLSKEKGHRFMVSAFHKLCAEGDNHKLFLIVVGDGVEQAPLEAQAAQLGIGEKVRFAGFQGNPGEWMRLFDCMVQPSLTEGTPNAVLEALCLRVPVVATAVGGVPDLIADGRNGLLVPPADVDRLADAMQRMAASSELRARLIAGADALTQEYSPAYQRQKLIEVYEEVFEIERESPTASRDQATV